VSTILSKKTRAAFIDRDGVINQERNYVHHTEYFELLPGAVQGLILLRDACYLLIIVANQAVIARCYYDQQAMDRLHNHLR
jgi:D-glycero-D-manno-heptose 1,7-bisphosphate phosphatase